MRYRFWSNSRISIIFSHAFLPSMKPLGITPGVRISYLGEGGVAEGEVEEGRVEDDGIEKDAVGVEKDGVDGRGEKKG